VKQFVERADAMESVSDSEESANAFESALSVVRFGRHGLLFSSVVVV
jgi:hypothetical protein